MPLIFFQEVEKEEGGREGERRGEGGSDLTTNIVLNQNPCVCSLLHLSVNFVP